MIDLGRLEVKVGDMVQTSVAIDGLTPVPFIVRKIEILNLVPVVYGENPNNPIPSSSIIVVNKNEELSLADKNKLALEEILQSIFPDRWDIGPQTINPFGSRRSTMLTIHFPEIEIKNSRDNRHLIRDLYVGLHLTSTYRIGNTSVTGTRSTRTIDEVNSNYVHSHLSSYDRALDFSHFCLGTGVINENLLLARDSDPSVNNFGYEILFESLNSFVAWESLEGGPYARITNISSNSRRHTSIYNWNDGSSNATTRLKGLLDILNKYNYNIPIEWNFNKSFVVNKTSIIDIDKDKLKVSLREFLLSNMDAFKEVERDIVLNRVIVEQLDRTQSLLSIDNAAIIRLINNEEPDDKLSEFIVKEEGPHGLVFRGEPVINKILDRQTTKIKLNNLQINDSLVKLLIETFNFKFYEKLFKDESEFINELTSSEVRI